ncbi:MAG: hypothetical protein IPP72_02350 [Chitinophagaceae bacterium]|nr:hypothetical protein [Chitinophagaceae bacterium]
MSAVKNFILFQAYGKEEILAECRFALLQLMQHNKPEDICIVLYTDNPTYFEKELAIFHNPIIEQVALQKITEWRGAIDFVHRVKIKVLQDFFSKHKGNLIYCDTDTSCQQSLSGLFTDIENGVVYMHTNEGLINKRNNIESKKWQRFLMAPVCISGTQLTDLDKMFMWNAGVIGMNSDKAYLLDQVLAITDAVYPNFPRHTVEQFAFSFTLQKNFTIKAAEDAIFHYWYLKEYRVFLQQFFAIKGKLDLHQQVELLQGCMPQKMMKDKLSYKKLPLLKKLFAKKWAISNYPLPIQQ